jgi:hypothetical protein
LAIVILSANATAQERSRPRPVASALNPNGSYRGQVTGRYFDGTTTTNVNLGNWMIAVAGVVCDSCLPGQYELAIGYEGTTYRNAQTGETRQELGLGDAYMNPGGNTIGFEMFPGNCAFLNPNNVRYPTGTGPIGYFGGHLGPRPGGILFFDENLLVGRISGRDCYNAVVEVDLFLVRQN